MLRWDGGENGRDYCTVVDRSKLKCYWTSMSLWPHKYILPQKDDRNYIPRYLCHSYLNKNETTYEYRHLKATLNLIKLYSLFNYSTVSNEMRYGILYKNKRRYDDVTWLQIGEGTWEVKFLSNNYTKPDTNPKTLTTLTLILTMLLKAFVRLCFVTVRQGC